MRPARSGSIVRPRRGSRSCCRCRSSPAPACTAADLAQTGFQGHEAVFFWGFVSSAVSGFLVIWGLLKYLKLHDFKVFMLYRLAVAD